MQGAAQIVAQEDWEALTFFLASTRKLEACVFVAIVACPATALDLVLLSSYLRDYRQDDAGCQNLMSDRNQ